jgi:Squalene-hopene cyclase C-terminal domain
MATSTDLRSAIEEVQEALPPDQVGVEGEFDEVYAHGALEQFAQRVGAMPWWVISATVHSVIFLLATLLTVSLPAPQKDEVTIMADVAKKEPPKYEKMEKREIFKNTQEVKAETRVERPVVLHEQAEVTEQFQTVNDVETQSARGQEDAISDIPLGGSGATGSMGVGGGGMAGCFGYREGGGKKRAVARFGGSTKTESAVEAALRWLSRHQQPEGYWAVWPKDNAPVKPGVNAYSKALTGFAMLAFLGAGHTEKSGKFRDNVRRAQAWLLKQQKKGSWDRNLYTQGICALAMAEAYGMTKNPALKESAQKGIDVILKSQGAYEGWNYTSKRGKAGRNDTSVTGWNLMALKSAKIAGLKVDNAGFQGTMSWLEKATRLRDGRCAYSGRSTKVTKGGGSMAMCAAGALMRQFMGIQRGDPVLRAAAKTMDKYPPQWKEKGSNAINLYYWYYGTLCMFQMGGNHWSGWNKAMKGALLPNQRQGGPTDGTANDVDGSWDPLGGGGVKRGGRVMSTALGALSLEVYYRYLPMYGK